MNHVPSDLLLDVVRFTNVLSYLLTYVTHMTHVTHDPHDPWPTLPMSWVRVTWVVIHHIGH